MFAAIGILGGLLDLAGLAYLLRLIVDRWGTDWHGMKSVRCLAGVLLAVLTRHRVVGRGLGQPAVAPKREHVVGHSSIPKILNVAGRANLTQTRRAADFFFAPLRLCVRSWSLPVNWTWVEDGPRADGRFLTGQIAVAFGASWSHGLHPVGAPDCMADPAIGGHPANRGDEIEDAYLKNPLPIDLFPVAHDPDQGSNATAEHHRAEQAEDETADPAQDRN